MKLKTILAVLFFAGAISPVFAASSTGVVECDQLLKQIEACMKPQLTSKEDRIQLDNVMTRMAGELKEMIAQISKEEAAEGCGLGIQELREEGCQ